MQTLLPAAHRIADLLKARKETVAIAESSAGGLIAAALLAVPGASAYFLGGAVVYTRLSRRILLEIPDAAMAAIRPSSEPYAHLLASSIRARFAATWGIGETGAAGPAGNAYGNAPGHACVAIAGRAERALTLETGHADRAENMRAFAAAALDLLEQALAG
jgi:PncC family amidohydrolase